MSLAAPHDETSEKVILGCALAGYDVEAARELVPEDFHTPAHQHCWRLLKAALEEGRRLDHLTLAERLKAAGLLAEVGGPSYLMSLDAYTPIGVALEQHVATVADRAIRRRVQQEALRAAAAVHDTLVPAERIAQESSTRLASLGRASLATIPTMADALEDLADRMHQVREGAAGAQYLPTYIQLWDELLGGLERGKLILLGAYPSVGKSALAATIAINRASRGHVTGYFTLEDLKIWLAERYVARETNIPARRLLENNRLTEHMEDKIGLAYTKAATWAANLLIDDRCGLSPSQIAATSAQMVTKRGADLLVVDNASEVDVDGVEDARHDLKTGKMVRVLRDVAKTHNVPVILLVHFKRQKMQSKDDPRYMRPTIDLFKNSGAFEEAARVAVGGYLSQESPEHVLWTIMKQTKGEKFVDFALKMHLPSGLFYDHGGMRVDGSKGYSEVPDEEHDR